MEHAYSSGMDDESVLMYLLCIKTNHGDLYSSSSSSSSSSLTIESVLSLSLFSILVLLFPSPPYHQVLKLGNPTTRCGLKTAVSL